MHSPLRLVGRLPDYAINGIGVTLGIGVIQYLIATGASPHAAQLALSGAVCASLADVPNNLSRHWRHILLAVVLSIVAASIAAFLKPHPVLLGMGVMGVAFVAMMSMSWGARTGPVAFAPVLSLVFTMAIPANSVAPLDIVACNAAGGLMYFVWSLLIGALLQHRYQDLALADALHAAAELLRIRAESMMAPDTGNARHADQDNGMQRWIKAEAVLAESLQVARDFVFAADDSAQARRDTAVLLRAVELRDVLLTSQLDLELLGADAAGQWLLQRIAAALRRIGAAIEIAALRVRNRRSSNAAAGATLDLAQFELTRLFAESPLDNGDVRRRLLPAVVNRLRNLTEDVIRIHGLLDGADPQLSMTRREMVRFVAPEGLTLAALQAQLSPRSPVMRHAVRFSLALGCAYFVAFILPWHSHPNWLVLSVAVVLRGNLEQTLARRNARVLGTMLGCIVVLVLASTISPVSIGLFFLLAVGVAHSFATRRYWLTATAATVMALLQSHMVNPAAGFAVIERVADTLIGAALAWAFSFVLPSWERRSLPEAIARVLKTMNNYATHALAPPTDDGGDAIDQRLARRRAYEALSILATALQRSPAEPESVRVPITEVATVLDHGQRFMAHLSMIRMTLSRRSAELAGIEVAQALAATNHALTQLLAPDKADAADIGRQAHQADRINQVQQAQTMSTPVNENFEQLPSGAPSENILPWLLRRLHLLTRDAQLMRSAAASALSKTRR